MLDASVVKKLREIGFVHVTGLPLTDKARGGIAQVYGYVQAKRGELGSWDRAVMGHRRARFMCITTEGQVWILGGDFDVISNEVLEAVCPNGRFPKASFPTFWDLSADDVLQRARDPYWDYNGEFSPVPQPVD